MEVEENGHKDYLDSCSLVYIFVSIQDNPKQSQQSNWEPAEFGLHNCSLELQRPKAAQPLGIVGWRK